MASSLDKIVRTVVSPHPQASTTAPIRSSPRRTRQPVARARQINGVTDVVLTRLDNYDELDEIPVCVGYEIDGKRFEEMPVDQFGVHHAKPIYEVLPGWKQDIGGCRTFEDLPVNAQRFVEFVDRKVGCRISVVGVGPAIKPTDRPGPRVDSRRWPRRLWRWPRRTRAAVVLPIREA
jgi:hypothetical protein